MTNGGGPATQNGKAVVRWNATRHGISSPKPVVPGLENTEDWESHLEGIMENLSPMGHLEDTLAERVALLSWRLHRVTRFETGAIAISQETIEDDIHDRDRFLSTLRHKGLETTHPEDIRSEAKYCKQSHSALRRFPSLGADKTLKGADTSSVVWGVLMEAKKAGRDIDVEVLDLPGVPEDAMIEELPAMKVADVYGPLSEGQPGLFGAVVGRAEAQVMRLAALYAVMNESYEIEREHLRAALALWDYSEKSARYIFGDAIGDPVADQIYNALRAASKDGMTRTEISHLFRRNVSSERIAQALSLLHAARRVRPKTQKTGGRHAERWYAA